MSQDSPILIAGTSRECELAFEKIVPSLSQLKKVTVFFENYNFLITNYDVLSNGVHMILEFLDGQQVQIEGTNCGYSGTGPNTTVRVLEMVGLSRSITEPLIFYNDAIRFDVDKNNEILYSTIDTSDLFYPQIRETGKTKDLNRIRKDSNYDIDLVNKKVTVYNPHRNSWKGFVALTSYMKIYEMEYYIGENSPLEGYYKFNLGKEGLIYEIRQNYIGIKHVNLILKGNHFNIVCLINRKEEIEIINTLHLSLTGTALPWIKKYHITNSAKRSFGLLFEVLKDFFKNQPDEIHERIDITEQNEETARLRKYGR
ncbi:hypothetical protein [Scatolibacter rhodanostii]|uniref:hypothetical protein n=1 Tax=Scatolibacter rhodanostii TaxID=2014781 RepID=UPI000C07D731|nr:hypothetical protein [Scatolibacter rhodanostii]